MAIEIVDFPIKHGGSFHSYVSLPEGKSKGNSPGKFFFYWQDMMGALPNSFRDFKHKTNEIHNLGGLSKRR